MSRSSSWIVITLLLCLAVEIVGALLPLRNTLQFRNHGPPQSRLFSLVVEDADSSRGRKQKKQTASNQNKMYWTLPRLYVGPRRGAASRDGMSKSTPLAPGALVRLSSDQTHYLTSVMRIFKKRKMRESPEAGDEMTSRRHCIRLFDGHNGEWLAKIHELREQHDQISSARARRRGRSPNQRKDLSLIAECFQQLRPQYCEDERPWLILTPLHNKSRMKM